MTPNSTTSKGRVTGERPIGVVD